ncbi:MAG TPA: S46 family peptidase [Flavisolibacter sp.]|nr:S46 family peptidase [Flavisolibacter sp.]
MKRITWVKLFFLLLICKPVLADEGMWLPQLLEGLNEKQMKSLGMKISAGDIYNINKGSLKDAIVSFGGFCTGEVISDKGLVLTNHHCGFDAIQDHSSLEHNYIKNGFWAANQGQEIPSAGLFVSFIIRIDDVTSSMLARLKPGMTEAERQKIIGENMASVSQSVKKEAHQDVLIRAFYEGNKYYLFVTETYRDVRLVGAPPSSIGNFGKDTDNWMWPRHTGDFSLFRIYAGKDNKPAAYSPQNVPYKPRKSLAISLSGVKEGDFTMVLGFPGRTTQYLPSFAVRQIIEQNDPAKIAIREKVLGVMDAFMRKDEAVKIQYAAKYASVQNAYKKWQGEVLGMNRTGGLNKKQQYEAEFVKRINANPGWKEKYGNLLTALEQEYEALKPYALARDHYSEIIPRIELFSLASKLSSVIAATEKDGNKGQAAALEGAKEWMKSFYKEYDAALDQKLFAVLIEHFVEQQDKSFVSPALIEWTERSGRDYEKLANEVYASTNMDDKDHMLSQLEKDPALKIYKSDKAAQLFEQLSATYVNKVLPQLTAIQGRINTLQRTYMQAQMEVFAEKAFYPDANSTLRLAYGQVQGLQARDAVKYDHYTFLDGVLEKYKPGDYEFDLPARLIALHKSKDFGSYGVNGRMPVCFIGTNHTTGGNSGSPALDAQGNLVGLNFDRAWEGTMSDLNYDPSICRNIMVDIRYVLFIIDKFAGAGHLVNEMRIAGR